MTSTFLHSPLSPKPKRCKRLQNVFLDDRGFPDQSNEYNLVRGCTGEFRNKIISLKLFVCELNVVGMVCWTNSCQKKLKKIMATLP